MRRPGHTRLGIVALASLVALGVLVSLVPVGGAPALGLFAVVVVLVAFLVWLVAAGALRRDAEQLGLPLGALVLGVLLAACALLALRLLFLELAG